MGETQLLEQARMALRIGDRATAQALLYQVVKANPGSETAWLWLSAIIGDREKERYCLQRVLAINPDNRKAQEHLSKLKGPPPAELFAVEAPAPQEPPAAASPQREAERPWYRSPVVLVLFFLFITPVWAALVLTDREQRTGVKVLAAVLAAGYLLLCGYVVFLSLP